MSDSRPDRPDHRPPPPKLVTGLRWRLPDLLEQHAPPPIPRKQDVALEVPFWPTTLYSIYEGKTRRVDFGTLIDLLNTLRRYKPDCTIDDLIEILEEDQS